MKLLNKASLSLRKFHTRLLEIAAIVHLIRAILAAAILILGLATGLFEELRLLQELSANGFT